MTVDVTTEIDIESPCSEVAAFAADPNNATAWYEDIESVRWETPPPLGVGSRVAFVAHFLGRHLAYTYEMREFVAGERLVMSTDAGPFPMETTYTWTDTPSGGTHVTLRNHGRPAGFGRLAAPLMAMQVRRATSRNLALLKRILENPTARG
ncbi:MAG: SRPBCC family protein [Chloroflexi bacterium]|nr:SRPBCC family protein [Chloroflexota bacterium]